MTQQTTSTAGTVIPVLVGDPLSQSADIVANNIDRIRELFPDAVTESGVDVEVLHQLLGEAIDDSTEKYGLNWPGKKKARQAALTPSTGTLLPEEDKSVDWDTTENIFIEGDNLEVLKLLQKSYAGKVKMIYIDPPYNTGNDFVYADSYTDSLNHYQRVTGQIDSTGERLVAVGEASGRFHSNWMSMIYPRLRLARNLLKKDGVIMISVDDRELPRLRLIADEVFGEEAFIGVLVWKSRQNKDNRTTNGLSVDHEYIVCYGSKIRGATRDTSGYSNPDGDDRGPWTSANMVGLATVDRRPNLHYDLVDPSTQINYGCPEMGWRYDSSTMGRLISEGRVLWPKSEEGRPRRKSFLQDLGAEFPGFSSIVGDGIFTRNGTADIDKLFSNRIFTFPKPVALIQSMIEQVANDGDIVLDFFAGSGTTGHALWQQCQQDGIKRSFILVQIPEILSSSSPEQKTAADFCRSLGRPENISELTRERLSRARKEYETNGLDLGFRSYSLARSNIQQWAGQPESIEEDLLASVENLQSGRGHQAVLTEILLKFGLKLTTSVHTRMIGRHEVHSVGHGSLFVCLSDEVSKTEAPVLATEIADWSAQLGQSNVRDVTVILNDSCFVDDVAKLNFAATLDQAGFPALRTI